MDSVDQVARDLVNIITAFITEHGMLPELKGISKQTMKLHIALGHADPTVRHPHKQDIEHLHFVGDSELVCTSERPMTAVAIQCECECGTFNIHWPSLDCQDGTDDEKEAFEESLFGESVDGEDDGLS